MLASSQIFTRNKIGSTNLKIYFRKRHLVQHSEGEDAGVVLTKYGGLLSPSPANSPGKEETLPLVLLWSRAFHCSQVKYVL